ncbi:MAG TPA: adenylyl-sulfate kinase [Candidatus Avibacteroides faecavium]|nr:adenylyl-sulfate kinase [Candidatus Avibacteroides faecavium]
MENIYPIFDKMLSRADKEALLGQRGLMVWFTGLSGSGKSTVAIALERELHARGILCRILDGDNVRSGINNNLGFSADDRVENIRRIAEVARLFVDTGIVTIAAFISPSNALREMAAEIIGKDDFVEVYVDTPLSVCEERDVKGLYKKARTGEVKNFTGISAPFEAPEHPALRLDTSKLTIQQSVGKLLELIMPMIKK